MATRVSKAVARWALGGAANIGSRRWDVLVNTIAASPLVSRRRRARLLRIGGLGVHGEPVLSGCYFFGAAVELHPTAWINHGCYFDSRAAITVGADCSLGMQVMLCTSGHDIGGPQRRAGRYRAEPIVIEDGVWLGARALVLGGVTIGTGCVVAAGAVVTHDLEPHGLYAGVPARRVIDLPVT